MCNVSSLSLLFLEISVGMIMLIDRRWLTDVILGDGSVQIRCVPACFTSPDRFPIFSSLRM